MQRPTPTEDERGFPPLWFKCLSFFLGCYLVAYFLVTIYVKFFKS
ncbi:hypothetical protein [Fibrisoma montanum]|nr:hypothetical protein [Fibrisoma montanum]